MSRVMTVSEARDEFADTVSRVAFGKERVVVKRRGKRLVAVVPMEDLDMLEQMEERRDIAAAKRAMKEKGGITLGELKRKLRLE